MFGIYRQHAWWDGCNGYDCSDWILEKVFESERDAYANLPENYRGPGSSITYKVDIVNIN